MRNEFWRRNSSETDQTVGKSRNGPHVLNSNFTVQNEKNLPCDSFLNPGILM